MNDSHLKESRVEGLHVSDTSVEEKVVTITERDLGIILSALCELSSGDAGSIKDALIGASSEEDGMRIYSKFLGAGEIMLEEESDG
jgi:hypothetical protein